ncbi:MAG TPA: 2Fe-2S iron-sulfur cluster-binding protein [Dissulfurispiraceae bacterium]|nr:2Fe-2S iron-sulfur cluster-binding protein [Dissulfurispiraceae bacterium]
MVTIRLNGKDIQVDEGMTVLDAARREGIDIPTLCYHEALGPYGVCRLCIVEAAGPTFGKAILSSCNLRVFEGLSVETDSPAIRDARQRIVELLLASTPITDKLMNLAHKLGVDTTPFRAPKVDDCVLCGLCVRVCKDRIGASALSFRTTGENRDRVAEFIGMSAEFCIGCGSCASLCPIGVIRVEDEGDERKVYLYGKVVNTLPLIRCRECGKAFTTQKFLDFVTSSLHRHEGPALVHSLCADCAREHFAPVLTGEIPPA